MAEIYDYEDGDMITGGLPGRTVSDEAIDLAVALATERNETVVLVDDGTTWLVRPDGVTTDTTRSKK